MTENEKVATYDTDQKHLTEITDITAKHRATVQALEQKHNSLVADL
jgi:hypothetical protein